MSLSREKERLLKQHIESGPLVPPGGPPAGPGPSKEVYALMGEEAIFKLCLDFYAALEQTGIRPLFPPDMPAASRKLAAFLVGMLGGPPLYRQQFGEPMMRRRHLHLPIDQQARDTWLNTFKRVLEEAPLRYGFPEEHLPGFIRYLDEFSTWMINRG